MSWHNVRHTAFRRTVAFFIPFAFTVTVMSPGVFRACMATTSFPWKRRMVGLVNTSSDVGSPLQMARNVAAPLTLTLTVWSASGHSVPWLSSAETVRNTMSSPSARSAGSGAAGLVHSGSSAVMLSAAGRPAVRISCVPATVPSAL